MIRTIASESELVKVELKLPQSVWEALCLVAEKFEETPDHWAALYIKRQLEGDVADYFRLYAEEHFGPLCNEIKKLLKDEDTI